VAKNNTSDKDKINLKKKHKKVNECGHSKACQISIIQLPGNAPYFLNGGRWKRQESGANLTPSTFSYILI
jgi:hypothetical protein